MVDLITLEISCGLDDGRCPGAFSVGCDIETTTSGSTTTAEASTTNGSTTTADASTTSGSTTTAGASTTSGSTTTAETSTTVGSTLTTEEQATTTTSSSSVLMNLFPITASVIFLVQFVLY